jgi:hypothetical protein
MRGICPEERTHFAGHPDGCIYRQTLQGLQVEHAIVERAFRTLILMNALPLPKFSFHRNHHSCARLREISESLKMSGFVCM